MEQAGGVTPWRWTARRSRSASPDSSRSRASAMDEPSPCTSSRPKGAVGSSISPSIVTEERLVLRVIGTEPRLGDEIPKRQRRRQAAAVAGEQCAYLGDDELERGVVNHQMVVQQHEQPAILDSDPARSWRAAAAPGECRCEHARTGARGGGGILPSASDTSSTAALPCARRPAPAPAGPPTRSRCAGCRGGRRPFAARRETGREACGCRTPEARASGRDRLRSSSDEWKRMPSCSGASG